MKIPRKTKWISPPKSHNEYYDIAAREVCHLNVTFYYLLQPSLHFNHTIILLPPMWFHCSKAAFCEMTRFVNLWHCTHLANTPMHPVNLDCATVTVGPKINQWYTPTNHRCFEIHGPKKIFGWENSVARTHSWFSKCKKYRSCFLLSEHTSGVSLVILGTVKPN